MFEFWVHLILLIKIFAKQGQRQLGLDFTLRQLQVMDETFERREETRTIWTIHRQYKKWRIQTHHLDLKRRKKHIYSTIAAHLKYYCSTFTAILQYIYSIIAVHLQHYCGTFTAYCSTFTALLQHISTPAQLQHISAQLQHIPAHLQHISAHFSLSHHITSSSSSSL